ncbi:MAG: ferritin-like domain-containing protein [Myxococcales bacterium FL481]|nr:MAG: ferritin-like domain-containing protein [Myxococcales bacterium FL481]
MLFSNQRRLHNSRFRTGAAIAATLLASGCGGNDEEAVRTQACYPLDDPGTETSATGSGSDEECRPADEVDLADLSVESWCRSDVQSIHGEGTKRPAFQTVQLACCYPVSAVNTDPNCVVGRPFFEGDSTRVAPLLTRVDRPHARAWLEAAQAEHASVAAFARLTLELMALGAPLPLLAKVQQAAEQEVRHTQLCLQRAAQLGAPAPSLGRFPFSEPIVVSADPVAVAVACVREGCLGETVGACLAELAVTRCSDERAAAALEEVAQDEARHAALSWEIAAWLIQMGGDEVRAAVATELQQPLEVHNPRHLWGADAVDPQTLTDMLTHIHQSVLEPAARLLAAA